MDTRLLNYKKLVRFFTRGDTSQLVREYNDLFCLFLSQIVYFSDSFITKYLGELGSQSVTLIDYDGPRAVYVKLDGIAYVAVKGLSGRNKSEWPIILNFPARKHETIEAHAGFVSVTRKLLPKLRELTAVDDDIILTGHSMGGAIATLTCLSVDGCKVVTFGSPKVVSPESRDDFNDKDMRHYCIDTDFVTMLPPFLYRRPGRTLFKSKSLNWLRFWDNHKLFVYSDFLIPALVSPELP